MVRGSDSDSHDPPAGLQMPHLPIRQLALTCYESNAEVSNEEHLQHQVTSLVHQHTSDNGEDGKTQVLDGLHAENRAIKDKLIDSCGYTQGGGNSPPPREEGVWPHWGGRVCGHTREGERRGGVRSLGRRREEGCGHRGGGENRDVVTGEGKRRGLGRGRELERGRRGVVTLGREEGCGHTGEEREEGFGHTEKRGVVTQGRGEKRGAVTQYSHPISCSQLVLRDNESHHRPKCTGQERVGHAHYRHGKVRDEDGMSQESEHCMCNES